MKKRYQSMTGAQYTFPVNIDGRSKWISFRGPVSEFSTEDERVQAAIEATKFFKTGDIVSVDLRGVKIPQEKKKVVVDLEKPDALGKPVALGKESSDLADTAQDNSDTAGKPEESNGVHPEVTTINEAVSVLRNIYFVPKTKLRNADEVKAQAAIVGATFPNWN